MFKEKVNTRIANATARLQKAFTSEAVSDDEVKAAFEEFGTAIADTVRLEFDTANGDQSILMQRGFRILTSEETAFYQSVIKAGKESKTVQAMNGLLSDKIMPTTIIEDVYKDLTQEHPLLDKINFQSVSYLTRWILNDHSVQTAVWGPVNDAITQQITSAFRTVEISQCKLSAYAVIELDMLDLGPQFLDGYIRAFLKEAIYAALENAIVSGTGKNQPIGMDRDIHKGVSVTDGAYPKKTAVKVKSFAPKAYGALLARLAVTEEWYEDASGNIVDKSASGAIKKGGNMRKFDSALLICNQVDYLTKVMPATTALNSAAVYVTNLFPFPTEVVRSNAVETGEAILCLPEEYFMGVGTGKDGTLTYSDDFKFLDDQRVFKVKLHGMGKAFDNTCAILLDISELEELYIYMKAADVTATLQTA